MLDAELLIFEQADLREVLYPRTYCPDRLSMQPPRISDPFEIVLNN